ncbi:MAG: hypothetical protein P8X68_06000 [Desulfobacterales bacterium]
MKKFLSIIALLLIISACSAAPKPSDPSPSPLNVRETWSGYAKGSGGECPDSEVQFKILDDFSIVGMSYASKYGLTIHLKGKMTYDGQLRASGTGSGFDVKFKGKFFKDSASGKWSSNWPNCHGTWELAKN